MAKIQSTQSKNLIAIKSITNFQNFKIHEIYLNEVSMLSKLINKHFAQYIPQHYIGYIDNSIIDNTMITIGLGPCIGVAFFNRTKKMAALAHIDDVTSIDSVNKALFKISNNLSDELEIWVSGGNHLTYQLFKPFVESLRKIVKEEYFHDASFPVNKGQFDTQVLGIDASGNVYSNIEEVYCHVIHPFKSPEIANIIDACDKNYQYSLNEVDFTVNNYTPIVGLQEFHPSYNEIAFSKYI